MNNKSYLFFFSLLLLIGVFYLYNKYCVAPAINLPALELRSLNQQPYALEQLKGQKVAICMAASWCVNCIDELNELARLDSASLGGIRVVVISDEPFEKIERFQEKHGYPFLFLKLTQPFAAIGINSIPTSYLLNTRFQVVKQSVGALQWSDPSTLKYLKTLMD